MFKTKFFSAGDIERGLLDGWLNSLNTRDQGMMVVGYGVFPASQITLMKEGMAIGSGPPVSEVAVTVKMWRRSASDSIGRTTIDELPEEPTINYPDDDMPEDKTDL